jgi:prepilin-type N-terminal cleavage/methylation domain-containing protein/prepilin-type processing-associated H-X9-DG protein
MTNCNPYGARRDGFTLVELLVVIGIIALLVSILLPALSKAQDSAKKVQCQSNLRQIVTGALLYAHDWKGVMLADRIAVGGQSTNWYFNLRNYLSKPPTDYYSASNSYEKNGVTKVLICPADQTTGGLKNQGALPFGLVDDVGGTTETRNDAILRSYNLNSRVINKKLTEVRQSAETIWFADFIWWKSNTNVIQIPDGNRPRKLWEQSLPLDRHRGKIINCAFVDGHVDGIPADTLCDDRAVANSKIFSTQPNFRMWFPRFPQW